MNMGLSFISFHLILLFSFLSFNGGSSCCTNLIEETCKNVSQDDPTTTYEFCKTSLQAFPASRCATFQEIGLITIRLLMNNATNTQCYIRELMGKKGLDPTINTTLDGCLKVYSEGIFALTNAIKYYTSGDYYGAKISVSAAGTSADDCEEVFNEGKGLVSPLTKQNKDLSDLRILSLVIIHMQM